MRLLAYEGHGRVLLITFRAIGRLSLRSTPHRRLSKHATI